MNGTAKRRRHIALTFRGIDCLPAEVEEIVGFPATSSGVAGELVKPTVRSRLARSYVRYVVKLEDGVELDEVFGMLMQKLGGVDNLVRARGKVKPEFFEIDIAWPIKFSEEQENGYFPESVIQDLAKLRCTLGFSFL